VTYLEKIKTNAVGDDVNHIKESQCRNHQNNSGIDVVPSDQPTLWKNAIRLRSSLSNLKSKSKSKCKTKSKQT